MFNATVGTNKHLFLVQNMLNKMPQYVIVGRRKTIEFTRQIPSP
jgi:hypothetical protein